MFTLAQGGTVDALLSDILVALDSYEVGEIRAKMVRGRLAKAQKGGYAGGKAPYGYGCQRHTKQLVLNEAEAQAVRELFILCAKNPGMTYREMAAVLAGRGYKGRNGKAFSVSLVYNILSRSDFYLTGRYRYAGIEVQGQHPIQNHLSGLRVKRNQKNQKTEKPISSRTIENYIYMLQPFKERFGSVSLKSISTMQLNGWLRELENTQLKNGQFKYGQVTLAFRR